MSIDISEQDGLAIITPQGEMLDHVISEDLKTAMLSMIEKGKLKITLDLKNIRHIRSAGIGLIISALKTIEQRGGQLNLCNLDENGRELFELCRLDRKLGLYDSMEEAVESLKGNK